METQFNHLQNGDDEMTPFHLPQKDNLKMGGNDKATGISGHKQHRNQVTAASLKPQSSCDSSVGMRRTALCNPASALPVRL